MSAVMRCPVCGARRGFPAMQTFTGRHQRMCWPACHVSPEIEWKATKENRQDEAIQLR